MSQPTQLRLKFGEPQGPAKMHIRLAGMTLVVTSDLSDGDLSNFFYVNSIPHDHSPSQGLSVSAENFRTLAGITSNITTTPDLEALLLVCQNPPTHSEPAVLSTERERLLLSWDDGHFYYTEYLAKEAVPCLVLSDIAFVATNQAWDTVAALTHAPSTTGRCSIDPEGYIKITTPRPQILESTNLYGLFCINTTTYGVPLKNADQLFSLPGFVWTSKKPLKPKGSGFWLPPDVLFSDHIKNALTEFLPELETFGPQCIVWDSGLGRRVFALACLVALDTFPATVVGPPSSIWSWKRVSQLFSKSFSVTDKNSDIEFVTYHDLHMRNITTNLSAMRQNKTESIQDF